MLTRSLVSAGSNAAINETLFGEQKNESEEVGEIVSATESSLDLRTATLTISERNTLCERISVRIMYHLQNG